MDEEIFEETYILDEAIIHIDNTNEKKVTHELLEALFGKYVSRVTEEAVCAQNFIEKLIKILPKPFTIVNENFHIDSSYRDTYYMYFSNQHFDIPRYSRRFSFFTDIVYYSNFVNCTSNDELNRKYIGSCVINPIGGNLIGRTLINPSFVVDKRNFPVYLRLSKYNMNILGQKLSVEAFPYRMQDQETMTCAEVTIMNLLEYYANSYKDYRTINPSEIISAERVYSNERVLPAKGITYPILTKVLADFGFSPRLYNLYAIKTNSLSKITPRDELKRWMHYYVESGIPVAINTAVTNKSYEAGHSVLCIGHGKSKEWLKEKAKDSELALYRNIGKEEHSIINSADFFDDYVIIDDNQFMYQLREYDSITLYRHMQVVNLAVPLYKRMFLDAPDAAEIIMSILQDKKFGVKEWAKGYLKRNESVIIRIFLASSRSFKNFRVNSLPGILERMLYSNMRLPRFIWVCELYRVCDYDKGEAFGEIVIDATSARNRGHKSLLMMHYPGAIAFRNPEEASAGFKKEFRNPKRAAWFGTFKGYKSNLTNIEDLIK